MSDRRDYQKRYREVNRDRVKRVNLTFDVSEATSLELTAQSLGVPLAAYVKSCAMQVHNRKVEPPEELRAELAELGRVIRTVANNVNQMARHSNTIGRVLDEQAVFEHIGDIYRELETVIAKVAHRNESGPGGTGT